MDMITALCFVLFALALGDVISTMTKAFIPSVFVSAVIFIIGFWTVFPQDIVDLSGIGSPFAQLSMLLLIVHMGTLMSLKELALQWRTMLVAFAGIFGICVGSVVLGTLFFGWDTAVIATPPLTGGLVASIMMSDAASAKGLNDLAVLAILMYVAQGFAGYPLTAMLLKKEGQKLLIDFRSKKQNSSLKSNESLNNKEESKFRIIPKLPEKYNTTYMILLKIAFVAFLSVRIEALTNGNVSKYVVGLILGAIASEIGFIDRKPLLESCSFGILITSLMAFVMSGLSKATPEMLSKMAVPMIGMIFFGVLGMAICSIIVGKLLGVSKEMSFAIALTALYGFPPNYILTEEASKALAETPEEKAYLMDQMLPQMLVGGFVTVTFASVIIAGLFIKFL